MARHRQKYTTYLKGNIEHTRSFYLFDEFGIENCKIEWIEDYPCNHKQELLKREGYYIQNTKCVNKNVAGRSSKQYYEDNKEHCLQRQKEYRQNHKEETASTYKAYAEKHKEEITIYKKEYRENNKEKIQQQLKDYYEANKDKIIQQQKEKYSQTYTCGCGSVRRLDGKLKHEKTKKHQIWLTQQEEQTHEK